MIIIIALYLIGSFLCMGLLKEIIPKFKRKTYIKSILYSWYGVGYILSMILTDKNDMLIKRFFNGSE